MYNSNHPLSGYLISAFVFFIVITSFTACVPSIQYLGDSYQATDHIDIYYDEKDVQKEYKTIGKMTHGNMLDYEVDTIKNEMIETAKKKGGDAIIFVDMKNIREQEHWDSVLDEDRISITAHVIRYTKS